MNVPPEHASVQIKNGEEKWVDHNESWAVEGVAVVIEAHEDKLLVRSVTKEEFDLSLTRGL